MILLAAALALFAMLHTVPAIPRAANAARRRFGTWYGLAYGFGSALALIAIFAAHRAAPVTTLYADPVYGHAANFILTFLAFVCLGIFLSRGSWRNRIRYPMAVAVLLWAAGHLFANGNTRDVLLFAGLAGAAAFQVFVAKRLVEFAPIVPRAGHNMFAVLVGVALYAVMAQLHGALIGVPVIALGAAPP